MHKCRAVVLRRHRVLPATRGPLQKESGKGHDLNVSTFERLATGTSMPLSVLELQHRMRPEISAAVRELTYPTLRDAEHVAGQPTLRGAKHTASFVNHLSPEGADGGVGNASEESLSKVNKAEAKLVLASLQHVLYQGYSPEDVVILTPYLGQLRVLRGLLQDAQLRVLVGEHDKQAMEEAGLAGAADDVRSRCSAGLHSHGGVEHHCKGEQALLPASEQRS